MSLAKLEIQYRALTTSPAWAFANDPDSPVYDSVPARSARRRAVNLLAQIQEWHVTPVNDDDLIRYWPLPEPNKPYDWETDQ